MHVALVSVHGLIGNLETLDFDNEDTGGQSVFIMGLAHALSKREEISKIDVITRRLLFNDTNSHVTPNSKSMKYWVPLETYGKVRIIRVGSQNTFVSKSDIWNLLPDFIDGVLKFYQSRNESYPSLWYGHFADGGFVCKELSAITKSPCIWTPHSLSLKKEKKEYRRLEYELQSIMKSKCILTSSKITKQILTKSYKCSENKIVVCEPGIIEYEYKSKNINHPILEKISDLNLQEKRIILGAGRAVPDKYFESLINLFIDNENMKNEFACIIILINQSTSYGKTLLDIISKNSLSDSVFIVPSCSHPTFMNVLDKIKENRGLFIHPSKRESFGLVVLEAANHGVPVIVNEECLNTSNLVNNLKCGISVSMKSDVLYHSINDINNNLWDTFSKNGIQNSKQYSWNTFTDTIVNIVKETYLNINNEKLLISDFDGTLFFENNQNFHSEYNLLLQKLSKENGKLIISTGRTLESLISGLNSRNVPLPEIIITSVGTEIWKRVNNEYALMEDYRSLITIDWKRDEIFQLVNHLFSNTIFLQDARNQREAKISYYIHDSELWKAKEEELLFKLVENNLQANIIQSGNYIDIIPINASKGNAVRFLSKKLNISQDNIITAGDSMNDYEMLNGITKSIVVGNASKNLLDSLTNIPNVYVSIEYCLKGVLEGIDYWFSQSINGNTCPYCNSGMKHNCDFLIKMKMNEEKYTNNIIPLYEDITIPEFLIEDINGTSSAMKILRTDEYKQYFFEKGNYFLYPDPKMGPIHKLNPEEIKSDGFWFVSWFVHPSFNPWWKSSQEHSLQSTLDDERDTMATNQKLSNMKKPTTSYIHTLCDIMKNSEQKNEMENFIKQVKDYLKFTFQSNHEIHSLIHFPVSPLYSTFHIHFVSGKYYKNYEESNVTIGRVISLDHLPDSFNELSCYICEFHPSRMLLESFSKEEIENHYINRGQWLCILCCTSFTSQSNLQNHQTTFNHLIK